jgi:hypothetical protein
MFEFAATFALALIYAIIIGVRKGAHKEGIHGVIAFAILFGIAFAIIGGLFVLFALVTG